MKKRRFTSVAASGWRTPSAPRDPAPGPASIRRKDLIPLDTGKIRKKALQGHQRAERQLAKLKDQLKRYHEQDVPGFRSWVHRTFGPLLTRQRELQRALEEKQAFIYELQSVAERYGLSEFAAYRKLLWRRAHPDEARAEDLRFEETERARRAARDAKERDNPFGDGEEDGDDGADFLGEDEFGEVSDEEWGDFSDFFEEMTGIRPPSRPAPGPHPDQKAVKDLYRTIVRRLHPDHHGQMSESRKSLWHEAQDAYRRHDVNALYSILARCDDGEAGLGEHSPVSLIQRLTRQLKRAVGTTRRDIGKLRRDMAWDYENRIRNPLFVRQVRQDLEGLVTNLEWTIRGIDGELARLDRLANRQVGQRPPRPRGRRPYGSGPTAR
jgi:hypothetical protein